MREPIRRWYHALIRKWERWQYARAVPAMVVRRAPVALPSSTVMDALERDQYLYNPLAFWLRPDRLNFKIPCWQIEGVWKLPPRIVHDVEALRQRRALAELQSMTQASQQMPYGYLQSPLQNLQNGMMNGLHSHQNAQMRQANYVQEALLNAKHPLDYERALNLYEFGKRRGHF